MQDMQPYGDDVELTKLECVNHAHKRMGSALRKLTKTAKLGGQGAGRLTLEKCNRLQSYYRNAIQRNLGNVQDMKTAVWATLHHSMSTDDQPQHEYCPQVIDSWCFYQAADPSAEPKIADHPCSTALSAEVAQKMRTCSNECYTARRKTRMSRSMPPYGCDVQRPRSWACVE